jgi:hypothetical protein
MTRTEAQLQLAVKRLEQMDEAFGSQYLLAKVFEDERDQQDLLQARGALQATMEYFKSLVEEIHHREEIKNYCCGRCQEDELITSDPEEDLEEFEELLDEEDEEIPVSRLMELAENRRNNP